MSTVSAISVAAGGHESNESPLGQLRAAHDALVQFVERWFLELSQDQLAGPTDRQIAELSTQFANIERQLDLARAEAANRPTSDVELASVQASLADSRRQNETLTSQLAAARAAEEKQRTSAMTTHFENRGMLAELHVLRSRAIELAEELSREKQHAMAERNLWNTELAHWRRLLETQFVRLAGSHRGEHDPRIAASPIPKLPAADAMLQSILADFQMLEHRPSSDS